MQWVMAIAVGGQNIQIRKEKAEGRGWGILLCKSACWRDHVDDDDYGDDGDDDGPKWQ